MPIWFGLLVALTETSCSQLRIAVVRGQPFLYSHGHDVHVFVNFVFKSTLLQTGLIFDSKLAHDAHKEL